MQVATRVNKTQSDVINVKGLCERWDVATATLCHLRRSDPDFPKPFAGLKSVFAVTDVERFERTRTFSVRINNFLRLLEAELKLDGETWARAVSAARKKMPAWGETFQSRQR